MNEEKKVYVGNLSYSIDSDQLRELFAAIEGVVISSADVIIDRDTNRSKGFGFVEFENGEMAQKAIEAMNGKEVDGRPLTVNIARPMNRDRGGDRGGFRR